MLLMQSLQSFSQQKQLIWAPVGAKWEYNVGFLSGNSRCSIFVEKDTMIQDKLCKKIRNDCSSISYAANYFLHIKNKDTIEYLLRDSFSLLYDFSKKIGDTVMINAYDPNHPNNFQCNIINKIELMDVFKIGNIGIRNFLTRDLESTCNMYSGNYVFEIFGPFRGYLFPMKQVDEIFHTLYRYTDSCWDIEPIINLENPIAISYSIKVNKSCLISAISNAKLDNYFTIYPNPAVNKIRLKNNSAYKIKDIQILDNLGKILLNYKLNSFQDEIDINKIPSGVNYLRLYVNNEVITKPLLVIR